MNLNGFNGACHWCSHPFNTLPIQVPLQRVGQGFRFAPGIFCSLSCARCGADALHPKPDPGLLTSLANQLDNSTRFCRVFIPRAPHWSCLELFGGPLSISQFRKGLATVPFTEEKTRISVQRLHATTYVPTERFHIKEVSAKLPTSMRRLLS
jgi:hypothetical protein